MISRPPTGDTAVIIGGKVNKFLLFAPFTDNLHTAAHAPQPLLSDERQSLAVGRS